MLLAPVSFAAVHAAHPWRPIPGCPGRYVLGAPTTIGLSALVGAEVPTEEHRVAAARDIVLVAYLDGGGLISYRRSDGLFVHTIGDADGFARKLAQLGIAAAR